MLDSLVAMVEATFLHPYHCHFVGCTSVFCQFQPRFSASNLFIYTLPAVVGSGWLSKYLHFQVPSSGMKQRAGAPSAEGFCHQMEPDSPGSHQTSCSITNHTPSILQYLLEFYEIQQSL